MAEEDKSQKTEQPTGKRLSDAKRKGQIAQSQEVKNWGILLAGTLGLMMFAPYIMSGITATDLKFIRFAHAIPVDREHLRLVIWHLLGEIGFYLLPFIGLLVVAGLAVTLLQVGWTFSWEKAAFKASNFSPISGVKKLVGPRTIVEFVKSLAKFVIVTSVVLALVTPMFSDIALFPNFGVGGILDRMYEIAIRLALGTVAVMTVVAALDFMYQKYQHIQKLKMTKQEIKDETKQSEGDPKVKQRLARIRMERAQMRMMAAVPHADVVITNPTHYAVALEYKMEKMDAPKLVAKGVDDVAQRIRDVAEEHDVPIVENPPLARALYAAVELDEEIPPEHYHAVAEVIGYVFRLKGKLKDTVDTAARGPAPDGDADDELARGRDETDTVH